MLTTVLFSEKSWAEKPQIISKGYAIALLIFPFSFSLHFTRGNFPPAAPPFRLAYAAHAAKGSLRRFAPLTSSLASASRHYDAGSGGNFLSPVFAPDGGSAKRRGSPS